MFSKTQKFEDKSKRVFITFEDTTWLGFFFVFFSWILNQFWKNTLPAQRQVTIKYSANKSAFELLLDLVLLNKWYH